MGTGPNCGYLAAAARAARQELEVVGVDPNPAMHSYARQVGCSCHGRTRLCVVCVRAYWLLAAPGAAAWRALPRPRGSWPSHTASCSSIQSFARAHVACRPRPAPWPLFPPWQAAADASLQPPTLVTGVAEALPVASSSCDAVVCTLVRAPNTLLCAALLCTTLLCATLQVLCSVADARQAVAEAARVLKPGGARAGAPAVLMLSACTCLPLSCAARPGLCPPCCPRACAALQASCCSSSTWRLRGTSSRWCARSRWGLACAAMAGLVLAWW